MPSPNSTQKLIPLDSPDEWSRALEGIPHGFCHTWGHCYAMHLTTGYQIYLYVLAIGDSRIICPIAERPCGRFIEATTPLGFSGFTGTGDVEDFPSIWESFARDRGYVTTYVTLNPLFDRPSFTNPTLTREHNTLYILDLEKPEEEITSGFSQSRRRWLRRWLERGVSVITDREILTRFFIEHYREFFLAKGFPPAYDFVESTIEMLLSLKQVYVVGAATESGVQSVLVCCFTCYAADSFLNISLPGGIEHGAGLMWHAAKHFRSLGIPKFNLGGGLAFNEGIAESKRRFGAYPMPLKALRQVVRPDIYTELCVEAGWDGSEGFFPPYQRYTSQKGTYVRQDSKNLR
jgi:hypothetical protein